MAAPFNDPDGPVVLALDTAGSACAVALCRGAATLAHERQAMRHGHATVVLPMIQDALRTAGLDLADIDRFVVNRGPGGFTGLRVGLATMGGLALATDRPLAGVDGFDGLARQAREMHGVRGPLVAAIDSRRADPYLQAFDGAGEPLGPPGCVPQTALGAFLRHAAGPGARLTLVGDAAAAVADAAGDLTVELPGLDSPDPAVLARIGLSAPAQRHPPPPLYLRPADAVPAPAARGMAP